MAFNRNKINILRKEQFPTRPREALFYLAQFGVIAPSSHNTQPWLFTINDSSIVIKPNMSRRLPHSDPANRQLWISIGAAAANIGLAATAYGLSYHEERQFDDQPKITLTFTSLIPGIVDGDRLQVIVNRHTNRLPLDTKPIDASIIKDLSFLAAPATITIVTDEQRQKQLQHLVGQAVKQAFADKQFRDELANWIRPSRKKYEDGMPGYTLLIPTLLSFFVPWIVRHVNIGWMQQKMHEGWLEHSAAYGVISSPDSINGWFSAGQALDRLMVYAEERHIRVGIMGAPVEIGDYPAQLQKILGLSSRPQAFVRLGYGPAARYVSPRLELSKVIR